MVKHALFPALLLLSVPLLGQSQCDAPTCEGLDSDGDGICDEEDLCPGFDDGVDGDRDGAPDACDPCPEGPNDDIRLCLDPTDAAISTWPKSQAILQRDGANQCELKVEGMLLEPGGTVAYLTYQPDDGDISTLQMPLAYEAVGDTFAAPFSFTIPLEAGLHNHAYTLFVEGTPSEGYVASEGEIACGDVILVQGQSNAVAGDYGAEGIANIDQSPWIRSFGNATTTASQVAPYDQWGMADGEGFNSLYTVGSWPLHMAANLLESEGVPIGLINGAVGGTSIGQHQRNDAKPEDLNTIYGRMLYRSRRARVANSAKRMIWYQGEADGSIGITYGASFDALYQDWKTDFPALEDIYVFQVRNGCGITHPFDAVASLDFYNADGSQLLSNNAIPFEAGSPGDGADWVATTLTRTAPPGSALAIHAFTPTAFGPVDFDIGTLTPAGGAQRLLNTGFEDGIGTFPNGWASYGDGGTTWAMSGGADSGRYLTLDSGAAGVIGYQVAAVSPGEELTLSITTKATYPAPYLDVREALRRLPDTYEDVTLMSTTGAQGHDGCHSLVVGYWELGDRLSRVIGAKLAGASIPTNALPPHPRAVVQEGPNTLRVDFDNLTGSLSLGAGTEGYFRARGAVVTQVAAAGSSLRLTLDRNVNATHLSYLGHPGDGGDILNPLGVGMPTFMDFPVTQQ